MREEISHELIVETVLNYGNEETVKKMFEILGTEYAAKIFLKQIIDKKIKIHSSISEFFIKLILTSRMRKQQTENSVLNRLRISSNKSAG